MRARPVLGFFAVAASACTWIAVSPLACTNPDDAYFHPLENLGGSGGAATSGQGSGGNLVLDGSMPPPAPDASGYCGNEFHPITSTPPTVYFVMDVSGSMSTPVPGGTRYSMLRGAAVTLVSELRSVIKVGAAVFPLQSSSDACHAGTEIFPPHFDDPLGFEDATGSIQPYGGTPTAATLTSLQPRLTSLPGKVIVILTTDGGANCNPNANCPTSDCTENIEGCAPGDACCAQGTNCCAPNGPAGPTNCLDRAAVVAAVGAVSNAGVKVYVIGIPGSQPYASVLTQMAFAGGAPMPSTPYYYDVPDLSTLSGLLKTIVGGEIPCDITIATAPSSPNETNVYFGQMLVPSDPMNGWSWSGPTTITLNGSACIALRSGEVQDVQIVSGCPTVTQ